VKSTGPRDVQGSVSIASAAAPSLERENLLERARRGDGEAFAGLLREHDRALRSLAFRLLGDRRDMDDVLQEAYVKAFRALPSFAGRAALGTWLYRIAYNACLDHLRRVRRSSELPLDEAAELADPAPVLDEAVARRLDLATALGALPPDLRAAVLLVDAEGLSYDEAAEVVGVPAGTIASRLNRARAALRAALAGVEGGEDS
jgi:RNA polymerase sigma-70 factor (ECF subfamily)